MNGSAPGLHVVRGLACPFDCEAVVDAGVTETFAPGAFQIRPETTEIHGFGHGTCVVAGHGEGGLHLWQNGAGLFFEVAMRPDPSLSALLALIRSERMGCSVNLVLETLEAVEFQAGGRRVRRICYAEIDHIAIAPNPCYSATAAWLATDQDAGLLSRRVGMVASQSFAGMFSRRGVTPRQSAIGARQAAYA